jgi:hypothetical protein
MRYLGLIVLVSIFGVGLNTPVFAQCCPAGCVPSGYGGCWHIGTNNSCPTISCPRPTHGTPSPPPTGPTPVDVPILQVQPTCGDPRYLTPEARAAATNQCIADLAGRAQLLGCWFEDDAGRAEDVRTGLSCPDRQRALANQCWRLCARFARVRLWCDDLNADWQTAFGALAGDLPYGSAYIDRCGPRLPYAGTVTRPPYFHP